MKNSLLGKLPCIYHPVHLTAQNLFAWLQQPNDMGLLNEARKKAEKPIDHAQNAAAQKRKQRDEYAQRNQIEGRIRQAKQALLLNQIKTRLKETSEAWIGATIFTLNFSHIAKYPGPTF